MVGLLMRSVRYLFTQEHGLEFRNPVSPLLRPHLPRKLAPTTATTLTDVAKVPLAFVPLEVLSTGG